MSSKLAKPKASFGIGRINVPGVLARASLMEAAFSAALAMFTGLPITMAAYALLIQAAAAAQSAAATRAKGLASLRDTKVDDLWTAMHTLRVFVQGLADKLDARGSTALIEAAGLIVAKTGKRVKLLVSATYVPATGVVHLSVNALLLIGKRTSKKTNFTWSWSTDGGKTWSTGVTTSYTSHDLPGLPPGT
jgi:hypothetical protein